MIGISKFDDPFQHFKVILLCGCVSVWLLAKDSSAEQCVCWFFDINKIVPILTFCVFFQCFVIGRRLFYFIFFYFYFSLVV